MTQPAKAPDEIRAYRANPTNKFGAKDGMETQPIRNSQVWNVSQVYDIAKNIKAALAAGMPSVGAEQLVNKILNEGRSDAGVNEFNTANPKAVALYNKMIAGGASELASAYAAAVLDKRQLASRLNIPFQARLEWHWSLGRYREIRSATRSPCQRLGKGCGVSKECRVCRLCKAHDSRNSYEP